MERPKRKDEAKEKFLRTMITNAFQTLAKTKSMQNPPPFFKIDDAYKEEKKLRLKFLLTTGLPQGTAGGLLAFVTLRASPRLVNMIPRVLNRFRGQHRNHSVVDPKQGDLSHHVDLAGDSTRQSSLLRLSIGIRHYNIITHGLRYFKILCRS